MSRTANERPKVAQAGPGTDLYQLWESAFDRYNRNLDNKVSIKTLPRIQSLSGVISQVAEAENQFSLHRNNKSRLARLRAAVGDYLGLAKDVGDLIVGSAVVSFPPAAAIWTVATYAIKTAQTQREDYDKLADLITETGGFLKVLQIIEKRVPNCQEYTECVTEVFASLLVVFAVQTRFMKENRALTFFRDAVKGNDQELATAYNSVRRATDRLSQANGFRAVANTEDLIKLMGDLNMQLEAQHDEMIIIFTEQRESNKAILDLGQDSNVILHGVDRMLREMKKNAEVKSSDPKTKGKAPGDLKSAAGRQGAGLNIIRWLFSNATNPFIQFREIESHYAKGTIQWIYRDDRYQAWARGETSLLCVTGKAGLGKSFLSFSVISSLRETLKSPSKASLAFYFFRDEHSELQSLKNALSCVVVQIAESDSAFCEKIAAHSTREDISWADLSAKRIWETYVTPLYDTASESELYLVLDGFDEVEPESATELLQILADIHAKQLRIHVLLTSRSSPAFMDGVIPHVIEIAPSMVREDIPLLVKDRCRTRNFTHRTKEEMINAFSRRADELLYVDRMLHEFKVLGSNRAVRKALVELPEDLTSLYAHTLARISSRKTPTEREMLRRLYAWLSFSARSLTLNEVEHLLSVMASGEKIRLDDEIQGPSASVLELKRSLVGEDLADDATDADPNITSTLDSDADDDDGEARLSFRESSLREYMRAQTKIDDPKELRMISSHAQLELFLTCATMITNPSSPNDSDSAMAYAANCWHLHFLRIDLQSCSEEQIWLVIKAIARIMTSTGNTTKNFELHCEDDDDYYQFLDQQEGSQSFLDTHKTWAERASSLDTTKMDETTMLWLQDSRKGDSRILRHFARDHLANFYSCVTRYEAVKPYGLVKCILAKRGDIFDSDDTCESDIAFNKALDVLSHFRDLQPYDASSYRAVALYLIDVDNNLALEACDESLKRCQDSLSLFFTHATFAKILRQLSVSEKSNLHKALDSAKTALAFDPNDMPPNLQKKVRKIRQRVLMIRAECEEILGNHNEAVTIYQQAKAEHPESSGGLLESVANILSKSGQYYELISIVETWGLEDRLYWLAYNDHMDFGMSEVSANAVYQKAAKLASKPSASNDHNSSSVNGAPAPSTLDLMVKRYKEMIEYLGRQNESACMRYQLAHAYWRVIGDAASAKNLYDSILNGDSCIDPATGSESTQVLMAIRFDLADLIFEEFRSSTDHQQKLGLLKELEEIPDRRLGKNIGELNIFNSQTAAMLARMIRKVRPAQDFQDQMEKVFVVCMDALTDTAGWNDQFSFYILSKVLICLPGLERDALISISLQISLVDPALPLRAYTPSEDGSEDGSEDEAEDVAERQAKNEAEEGAKDGAEKGVPHPLSPPQETTALLTPDNPHDEAPEAEEGKVNGEAPTDLRLSTDASIAMVKGKPWNEEQITNSDGHLSAQSTTPPAPPTPDEPPEDLAPWAELSCNGGCGRSYETWAEMGHLYTCLICAACDLCEECYDKRQKMNAGDQTVSWRSFCGQDHEYLKGPIEGWKGVKAEMISIGDEEPVAFKEWLRGLREERWKAAWRAFWKGG